MNEDFYTYQRQRLGILLGWGGASVLVCGVLQCVPGLFWRQVGLQCALWGAIDAVLAILGRRSARAKAGRALAPADEQKDRRGFRRILLVNAWLDVGYVLCGAWLIWRLKQHGIGAGILLQGAWLLLFDSLLAREVKRRWWR